MKLNLVPARTGLTWVKLGIATFFKQPLALAGLFFLYIAAIVVVAKIPFIGLFIGGMLVPGATLGLMAAAAEASKGKFPMPTILISAFRAGKARGRAMLVLGAIYTGGSLLATWLATLIGGPAAATSQGTELDFTVLIALALHTPLFLMFWHAPALVHWHGVSPVKSLFFSVIACLRNFGALAIYGMLWLGIFLGAGIVFGLVGGIIGGEKMARAVMLPMALMLAAMFSTSIYFTFRDSFVTDETPPTGESP